MTNATAAWDALPIDIINKFRNVAHDTAYTPLQWFSNEIPQSIWDNANAIRTLMDGGVVTVSRVVGDRGVAGGGYTETETFEFPDRDFSRHVSGHNGGEYTPDNVTLESASINRSRGADNMTADEIETAQTALESDASILADADIITPAGDVVIPPDVVMETPWVPVESGGSLLGDIGETVMDGLLPATVGLAMGKHVADQFDDDIDKIGYGSMAMGGTVLLAMTPPGQIAIAGYAAWNVCKLVGRGIDWVSKNA